MIIHDAVTLLKLPVSNFYCKLNSERYSEWKITRSGIEEPKTVTQFKQFNGKVILLAYHESKDSSAIWAIEACAIWKI